MQLGVISRIFVVQFSKILKIIPLFYIALVLPAQLDCLCRSSGYIFMKKIPLSQNSKKISGKYFALIDDEDYESVGKFKWCYRKGKNQSTGYAARGVNLRKIGGGTDDIKMHRFIMGLTKGDGKEVDHKDGNGLNNQKNNLRLATNGQNSRNRRSRGSSKYLGVSLIRRNTGDVYYSASIQTKGKRVWLGCFPPTKEGEKLAAMAYNEAAIKYEPEFSRLNKI